MFFYFAKVTWFVAQPSSLVVLALALAWWKLSRGIHRVTARLVAGGLAIGLAALSPLPNLLILPLEQRFARAELTGPPVTGIVILGGGEDAAIALKRHAHALNEAGERISEAVALSRLLPDARIVFSGGTAALIPGTVTEAQAVRDMLISMGVAAARITVEDRSRDTFENAVFTKALVVPKSPERWLLLTSAWHMPRAMGAFRFAGFPVEPWPVDYRTTGWGDALMFSFSAADGLRRLEVVGKEYAGLLAYRLNGRSSSLFPGPCEGTPTCE